MDVEAAASADESWRLSEDEAEAAEAVMFAKPLLKSLIKDASNDSRTLGIAAMTEVKLLISLIKSRGSTSMTGAGVVSGFWSVPSACPQLSVSNWCSGKGTPWTAGPTAVIEKRRRREIKNCMLMTVFRGKDSGTAKTKRETDAIEESTRVCGQQDPYVPRICWKV